MAGTEKEILCKIFDCNLELESMSSIDIFQTSEQISQKNSSFLAILANTKQLKSKHANLRNFLIKISVEYSEKEKKLKELKSVLINIKESSGSTYSKSVYEIAELEKSAKVLKEQLNYKKNPVFCSRQEQTIINELVGLIKQDNQSSFSNFQLNLNKKLSDLEGKIEEKEQMLAESKIIYENSKSEILQNFRMRKNQIFKASKQKYEHKKMVLLVKTEKKAENLKNTLKQARKEENQYYTTILEIQSNKEIINVFY